MRNWRPLIAEMASIMDEIRAHDRRGLWQQHAPEPGASRAELADAERRLGLRLHPFYRRFLGVANGWRAFWTDVDLYGTRELLDPERTA